MNRWTGIGRITKDPKLLETSGQPAVCAMRIAVKLAGTQGRDGHFDLMCFDDQARVCADYAKVGRELAIDGHLVFDEFRCESGSYGSRVYIVAERIEFLGIRAPHFKAPATGNA